MRLVPIGLTLLRAMLAPVVILLALYAPLGLAFGVCMLAAFLSDVFDGIIARRLGIATPRLRRLDSIADSLFYFAALFAVWYLHPAVIYDNLIPIGVLLSLEATRYVFDWWKFGQEASYHMWSSKAWGIALFVAFFLCLTFGMVGVPVQVAIYLGILCDLEGLAISFVLKKPKTDVPTLIHAIRISASDAAGK